MVDFAQRARGLMREPSRDDPHDPERFRRVALSRAEMMAQGAAMIATLDGARDAIATIAKRLQGRPLRRIVLLGCGDSWFSGLGVRWALERVLGVPVEPAQALDFVLYGGTGVDAGTLAIGLSSSGNTPAVTEGLRAAAARGAFVVALSNTAGSPLLRDFDASLLVRATRGGWPTQSSTSAMALMLALGLGIAAARGLGEGAAPGLAADLAGLPALLDAVAQDLDARAEALGRDLARAELVLFAGAGPHYAPAAFGAAKLKELAAIHAVAMPLEEYHHYRTQKAGDPLFLIAPDAASHERALDTAVVGRAREGLTIALLPEGETEIAGQVAHAWHLPPVRAELAPILYGVPLHLFSFHVTQARDALELGAPRLGGPPPGPPRSGDRAA